MPNLSGTLDEKETFIIGNDPKQKCEEPKISFLNEKDFREKSAKCRSESGKYGKYIKAFEESEERFATIECKNRTQSYAIVQAFRNEIKHGKKLKARSKINIVFVEKLS